jgi:hypothetical protein
VQPAVQQPVTSWLQQASAYQQPPPPPPSFGSSPVQSLLFGGSTGVPNGGLSLLSGTGYQFGQFGAI